MNRLVDSYIIDTGRVNVDGGGYWKNQMGIGGGGVVISGGGTPRIAWEGCTEVIDIYNFLGRTGTVGTLSQKHLQNAHTAHSRPQQTQQPHSYQQHLQTPKNFSLDFCKIRF